MNLLLVKKLLNMLNTCSMRVLHEIFLAPAVSFVIFMAQRSLANIAVLRVRAKFTRILSDSEVLTAAGK